MEHYQKLQQLLGSFEEDFRKFYEKGNNAAGTRIRKHMQELKKMAQEVRNNVQDKKATEK